MIQNPRAGSWSIPLTIILQIAAGINIGENKSKEAGFRRRKNGDMLNINNSCGWPNRNIFFRVSTFRVWRTIDCYEKGLILGEVI